MSDLETAEAALRLTHQHIASAVEAKKEKAHKAVMKQQRADGDCDSQVTGLSTAPSVAFRFFKGKFPRAYHMKWMVRNSWLMFCTQ